MSGTTNQPQSIDLTTTTTNATPFQFQPVVFADSEQKKSLMELAREKHAERARKFNTEIIEPKEKTVQLLDGGKKYYNPKTPISTGFDISGEKDKIDARKQRFGNIQQTTPTTQEQPVDKMDEEVADEESMMEVNARYVRREAEKDEERRWEAIYMHGCDLMTNNDMFNYYSEYGPAHLEWLTESSCLVVFLDKFAAIRALQNLGVPHNTESIIDGVNVGWHDGKKKWQGVTLTLRIATIKDQKPEYKNIEKPSFMWLERAQQQQKGRNRGDRRGGVKEQRNNNNNNRKNRNKQRKQRDENDIQVDSVNSTENTTKPTNDLATTTTTTSAQTQQTQTQSSDTTNTTNTTSTNTTENNQLSQSAVRKKLDGKMARRALQDAMRTGGSTKIKQRAERNTTNITMSDTNSAQSTTGDANGQTNTTSTNNNNTNNNNIETDEVIDDV